MEREISWAKRLIQQHLGHVSCLLKAFADYGDSLCGTPYPIEKVVEGLAYEGKMIEGAITLRNECWSKLNVL